MICFGGNGCRATLSGTSGFALSPLSARDEVVLDGIVPDDLALDAAESLDFDVLDAFKDGFPMGTVSDDFNFFDGVSVVFSGACFRFLDSSDRLSPASRSTFGFLFPWMSEVLDCVGLPVS